MQDIAVSKINDRIYWGNPNRSSSLVKALPKETDLVTIQKQSYQKFLTEGIGGLLQEISPISDFTGKNWQLEFGDYTFSKPRFNPEQAQEKGVSYDAPLRVKVTLTNLQTKE